jgi:hypothetical protein
MRAKLIKRDDDFYSLKVDGIVMATSNGMLVDYRLSLKNCDEIFGVVDVEKLADDYFKSTNENAVLWRRIDFKEGFNKAMELNKDKLFTLGDIDKAIEWATINGRKRDITHYDIDNFIQSTQQPSEIEVEIEMEEVIIGQCDCECHSNTSIMHFMACCNPKIFTEPKLDENGCLILKRKI